MPFGLQPIHLLNLILVPCLFVVGIGLVAAIIFGIVAGVKRYGKL